MKSPAQNSRHTLATAIAALTTCAIALPVLHAQPAPPPDDNETIPVEVAPPPAPPAPPAAAPMEGEAPPAAAPDPAQFDWRNATPEQRQAMIQQMQAQQAGQAEAGLRRAMNDLKFTDKTMQDVILAHLKQREAANVALQAKARDLGAALRNNAVPPAQLLTILAEYQGAVEADRASRREAEAALDAQVKYSQDPRLQTFLVLLGGVGDGPSLLQQGGGRGGRGGGFPGGGRGNRGNRGGGNNGGAPQDTPPDA